jgi:uncharacterized membrane protein YbhN (UPF0104 family)
MNQLRKFLPVLLSILIFSICVVTIRNELHHYSLKDIMASLAVISPQRKLEAIALTILGYLAITSYDFLAFHYIKRTLTPFKIAFTSFLSYGISNTIGLSLFSSAAIRYHFYRKWGISLTELAKITIFTNISFWVALLTIGGIVFVVDPITIPLSLKLPFKSIQGLGIFFLLIIGIYLIASATLTKPIKLGSRQLILPSLQISVILILISTLDWSIAAGVLYRLLPPESTWSYLGFFGIYIFALTAGLISTVPGGLGVFETIILLLRPASVTAPDLLGSLIVYRAIYFFLPFLVAVFLFIIYQFREKSQVD